MRRIPKFKLNNKYKPLAFIATFIVLAAAVLSAFSPADKLQIESSSKNKNNTVSSQQSSLELAMVGDMLPHQTITNAAQTEGGYDYLSLISPRLQDAFQKADLRFCNQEAVSAGNIAVSGYPAFNAPAEFARDISKFGCNLISTANNHAADKGPAGIAGTLETWSELSPLAVSGMYRSDDEDSSVAVIQKNDIKVGFVAFNEVNNTSLPASEVGINMLSDTARLTSLMQQARQKSELVIVSVHWGKEDSHQPTAAQQQYARQIADLGADIIVGSGPHVWQPYQVLQRSDGGQTHLWNSVGNGLNSQTTADQLVSGVALMKIIKNKSDGKIIVDSPRVLPTYMHYTWGSGQGLSQAQLLARKDLKWGLLNGSQPQLDSRNDFKTTEQEQFNNLKKYINNNQVEILTSY